MKYSKWMGLLSAIMVVVVCYIPWIFVPAVHLQIGGMFANGKQNFGRPGFVNILFSVGAAIFFMLPRVWAKRANIFFCGFNIAWAIRNYILLSRCYGGDCPEKQMGLYLLVFASALMLLMAFIPDTAIKEETTLPDA